jgi:hypothetical protein
VEGGYFCARSMKRKAAPGSGGRLNDTEFGTLRDHGTGALSMNNEVIEVNVLSTRPNNTGSHQERMRWN